MTSLQEGSATLTPEEYAKNHQKAFRVAFDFLRAHFPPGPDTAWWEKTANDIADAYETAHRDLLTFQLLHGVYEYIGEEWKRRYLHETDDQ